MNQDNNYHKNLIQPIIRPIGAHVSIHGGLFHAPQRAQQLGATAFGMFVKNQRRWQEEAYTPETIARFQQQLAQFGIRPEHVLVHSGYLINLGSPKTEVQQRSRLALTDELQRCEQLGLRRLVLHPGSHLHQLSEKECLIQIAQGIDQALAHTQEQVVILLENSAGQGTNLGYRLEQLAFLIEQVIALNPRHAQQIGVCIDTCHLWAAGYDFSSKEGYHNTWQQFERQIGWPFLYGIHINDSYGDCGSHLDRHAPLGQGSIGQATFMRLLQDPRLAQIAWILETPDESCWVAEINWLRTNGKTDD